MLLAEKYGQTLVATPAKYDTNYVQSMIQIDAPIGSNTLKICDIGKFDCVIHSSYMKNGKVRAISLYNLWNGKSV